MLQVHSPQRQVLLPRRLIDRTPLEEPGNNGSGDAGVRKTWDLTERIEALPGVWSNRTSLPDGTVATDFFIESSVLLRQHRSKQNLMCHIDGDGIFLPRVSTSDTEEILMKGWGIRAGKSIRVFLPRDRIEKEIAWRVILLAYRFETSQRTRSEAGTKIHPMTPGFASSAKYWV